MMAITRANSSTHSLINGNPTAVCGQEAGQNWQMWLWQPRSVVRRQDKTDKCGCGNPGLWSEGRTKLTNVALATAVCGQEAGKNWQCGCGNRGLRSEGRTKLTNVAVATGVCGQKAGQNWRMWLWQPRSAVRRPDKTDECGWTHCGSWRWNFDHYCEIHFAQQSCATNFDNGW